MIALSIICLIILAALCAIDVHEKRSEFLRDRQNQP